MFITENPKHEWCMWDFRLAKGYELREDMLTGGVPIYWDRSDRVAFEAGSYISKSRAVIDRAMEKAQEGKKKNHGKVFYPIPKTVDGGPLPTLEEFVEEQRLKKDMTAGNFVINPSDPFDNANWSPEGP